jgi:hypothetical protein
MTPEQFCAIVHKLRLTPTKVPNVFKNEEGAMQRVPCPSGHSPEQIKETAEHLIKQCGRSLAEFDGLS